jgi:hypothetical protein
MSLPTDSKARKETPLVTGCLDYFPLALAAVARVSFKSNQKHNPGQPLHWSRDKSNDHIDAVGRHLLERGQIDPDSGESATAHMAWRALAALQIEEERKQNAQTSTPVVQKPVCQDLYYIGPAHGITFPTD